MPDRYRAAAMAHGRRPGRRRPAISQAAQQPAAPAPAPESHAAAAAGPRRCGPTLGQPDAGSAFTLLSIDPRPARRAHHRRAPRPGRPPLFAGRTSPDRLQLGVPAGPRQGSPSSRCSRRSRATRCSRSTSTRRSSTGRRSAWSAPIATSPRTWRSSSRPRREPPLTDRGADHGRRGALLPGCSPTRALALYLVQELEQPAPGVRRLEGDAQAGPLGLDGDHHRPRAGRFGYDQESPTFFNNPTLPDRRQPYREFTIIYHHACRTPTRRSDQFGMASTSFAFASGPGPFAHQLRHGGHRRRRSSPTGWGSARWGTPTRST